MRVKVLSMGPGASGKSCIIKRYCEESLAEVHRDDRRRLRRQARDDRREAGARQLLGPLRARGVLRRAKRVLQGHAGRALVFDVANRESFESLGSWLAEAKKFGLGQGGDAHHRRRQQGGQEARRRRGRGAHVGEGERLPLPRRERAVGAPWPGIFARLRASSGAWRPSRCDACAVPHPTAAPSSTPLPTPPPPPPPLRPGDLRARASLPASLGGLERVPRELQVDAARTRAIVHVEVGVEPSARR